ncbi:MAG: alcohol dehydrogenase related protein [uncultured bacterium (gcode 4)]|uniref:Alcohol dehydrogenase related protein n=1 Tax=uncultured bacterium (gcode 4) TaxID=1234023 RepID=K1XJN1_9BACT|nr:MAG: alcohol dehydrogenase related protein [uncultured bacterium (gcode 4)]
MLEIKDLHPLAIWTYWLWANRYESQSQDWSILFDDSKDMEALMYQHKNWQNYVETSFIYAWGQTMKFLWKFLKNIPRKSIYVSVKVENFVEKPEDIEQQLDTYLQIMWLDFVDEYKMHTPTVSKLWIQETYYHMKKLIEKWKVRYLWACNLSLDQLKILNNEFEIKTFEGLYNLECKINEDVGIIKYCQDNDIRFICYQPLRRNRIANNNHPFLRDLAKKYSKTQNQILLNRIIQSKKIWALVKTSDINIAKENLDSLNFTLDQEDINILNNFRDKRFDEIKVDRDNKDWISIWKYANQID